MLFPVQEALGFILPVLKHAVDLLKEEKTCVANDHIRIQSVGSTSNDQSSSFHHSCSHSHANRPRVSQVTSEQVHSRPRKSVYPMISVDEATRIVLANTNPPVQVEEVDLMNALNRVSASSVRARDPLPPFPASVKDGFAVCLSEAQWGRANDKAKIE